MAEPDGTKSLPQSRIGGRRHAVEDMYNRLRLTSKAHPNPNFPTKFSDEEGNKMVVFVEAPTDPNETLSVGDIVRLDGTMVHILEVNAVDDGFGLLVLKIP
jgi:hypothetical protein